MKPRFFPTPATLRKWLKSNHAREKELWVGFYKKDSGRPSITWTESVDQALCFGWIDSIRRSYRADSYVIRFTPRKERSIWSAVNTKRVKELIALGLMQEAGLRAFRRRDLRRSELYSFEQAHPHFSPKQKTIFQKNPRAWKFFQEQPAGYIKMTTWWVISAKLEATRSRRLATLIEDSSAGLRIAMLRQGPR